VIPDRQVIRVTELLFDDELPVIVTEKDAIMLRTLDADQLPQQCYYLEIEAQLDERGQATLSGCLRDHGLAVPVAPAPVAIQG
jgi:hypothetical protein